MATTTTNQHTWRRFCSFFQSRLGPKLPFFLLGVIIIKRLALNLAPKNRFKKVLDLANILSKDYNLPNRKLVFKDLLDVTHNQYMQRILVFIEKEGDIFGLLLKGDGARVYRNPLLIILFYGVCVTGH